MPADIKARRDAALERFLAKNPQFGVGNRSGSRPGHVGRVVAPSVKAGSVHRPVHAWKRRSGFVGQATASIPTAGGSSAPINQPGTPTAQPHAPPYPCPRGMDPNYWDFNRGCPIDHVSDMSCGGGVTMNCDTESPCGVNVIGGNTLGTDGIPPGEVVPLSITAGDATKFHTKAIYFEALPFAQPDLVDVSAIPPGRSTMPIVLVDALVGRISQLRRGGSPDVGLTQGGYSNTKELVPVDWAPFTSTTEHNLALLFFNPNAGTPVHVFANLWGDI